MNGQVTFPIDSRSSSPISIVASERVAVPEVIKNAPVLTEQKQFAQDLYYQTHGDESPLTRQSRLPVHERLGKKNGRRVRFDIPLGTNTFSVLPKNRINRTYPHKHHGYYQHHHHHQHHRYGNYQNNYNRQGGHIYKRFRAQDRINRIRQNQFMSRSFRVDDEPGPHQARPFRLRRVPANEIYAMTPDITMRIANPKRFKIQLNPAKQAEIRDLQAKSPRIVHHLQYKIQDVHATTVKLNHRFSQYT